MYRDLSVELTSAEKVDRSAELAATVRELAAIKKEREERATAAWPANQEARAAPR